MMHIIPYDPIHGDRADKVPAHQQPCIVCGRACHNPVWAIHLYSGLYAVTEEEMAALTKADAESEIPAYGDTGMHPIGSDCLRKHPELKPYAQKQ